MRETKFSKAFEYLLSTNEEFMKERKRLCCQKSKPYKSKFGVPQVNLLSTYKEHFPPKNDDLDSHFRPEPRNKTQTFGLPQGRVPTETTYNRFHEGRPGELRDPADWDEGFKLSGPMTSVTTYDVRL
jgi:hypothetical protein